MLSLSRESCRGKKGQLAARVVRVCVVICCCRVNYLPRCLALRWHGRSRSGSESVAAAEGNRRRRWRGRLEREEQPSSSANIQTNGYSNSYEHVSVCVLAPIVSVCDVSVCSCVWCVLCG